MGLQNPVHRFDSGRRLLTKAPEVGFLSAKRLSIASVVPRLALTPREAAASIGCSEEFFRERVDHELRWVRRGRKRFVPVAELERWAERSAEQTL
jgi:excisionase family DNA binding protein